MIHTHQFSFSESLARVRESRGNQHLSVAAGLSVVSLLHGGHVIQQPRPNRLVHRHLEGHLFEHLTHRRLEQTPPRLDSPTLSYFGACRTSRTMTLLCRISLPPGSGVS